MKNLRIAIVAALLIGSVTPVLAQDSGIGADYLYRQQQSDNEYRMRRQETENNRRFEELQRQQRETQDRLDAQQRRIQQESHDQNLRGRRLWP